MFYQLTILLMYMYLFYSSNLGRKVFKYKVYGIHYFSAPSCERGVELWVFPAGCHSKCLELLLQYYIQSGKHMDPSYDYLALVFISKKLRPSRPCVWTQVFTYLWR